MIDISVVNRRVRFSSSCSDICLGIADDAALGAAERNVDQRAFPGHPHRQRLDLVERHVGMEADAALARSARQVVLHAIAGKHAKGAVVHADGNRNLEHALGLTQIAVERFVQTDQQPDFVELALRHLPNVIARLYGRKILSSHISYYTAFSERAILGDRAVSPEFDAPADRAARSDARGAAVHASPVRRQVRILPLRSVRERDLQRNALREARLQWKDVRTQTELVLDLGARREGARRL